MFGYPPQKNFEHMLRTIKYFPVIIADICNANNIYRCDVPTLKGKNVRQQPKRVQAECIEAPDSMNEKIGNLTVADDVMFANGIPFVVSVSGGVNLKMVEYVIRRLNT